MSTLSRTGGALLIVVALLPAQRRQEETGPAISPENPVYLYAHFRDTDDVHLRLSYSTESAGNWREVNPAGSFAAPLLRDPSVLYVPEARMFYFITTPATGTQIQFFSSPDLVHFSAISTIDMASYVPGATTAWAPEWWRDPQSGSYYFFTSISRDPEGATSPTAQMYPYLVPFDPVAGALTGWPTPLILSGTTQARTFDCFPYYDGKQYYLFYVDQQPGGSGANATQPIAYATGPTLQGPYTQQTIRGTDYFGLGTFQSEAPTLIRLGETECVRIVFDTWVTTPSGARVYTPVYRDSCTAAGPLFSQTSFVDGPIPLDIAPSEHGTIIALTDRATASIVFAAAAGSVAAAAQ